MKRNQVRIIAGKWRGRKVSFPDAEGLRPTPDRVRETVFNWLAPFIIDARCLDLFAGSAVLGFESLSRGAAFVVSIEQNSSVTAVIKENISNLKAESLDLIQANSLSWLQNPNNARERFDIVFVDPPYRLKIIPECFKLLEENGFLNENALIQFESEEPILTTELPTNWRLLHEKKAGKVFYYLAKKSHTVS